MRSGDAFCSRRVVRQRYLLTKHMMVLYNIAPALPGHSLVVPRRHVEQLTELKPVESKDLFETLQRVVPVLDRLYAGGSRSYELIAQVGPYSSRTVPHVHIHVIPRRKHDKYSKVGIVGIFSEEPKKLSSIGISKEVSRLRKEFATK